MDGATTENMQTSKDIYVKEMENDVIRYWDDQNAWQNLANDVQGIDTLRQLITILLVE